MKTLTVRTVSVLFGDGLFFVSRDMLCAHSTIITRMKRILMLGMLVTSSSALAQNEAPFSGGRWTLNDSAKVESVDGRDVLDIRQNGRALLRDARLQDGTIDADVMVSRKRSFVYVNFRVQDEGNAEEFYLRPHKSGLPDALQYGPVRQGQTAWQLYYGSRGAVAAEIPDNVWNHLRIVLSGRRAAFFLGDTAKPVMLIDRLGRDPAAGDISFSGFFGVGTTSSGPVARYSNVRVRPGYIPFVFPPIARDSVLSGVVSAWSIGNPFAAPDSALWQIDPAWTKTWTRAIADTSGLTELLRFVQMPRVTRYVGAVARIRINASEASLRRFDLGFSDRATVFLNGQPFFYEDKSYDFLNRRDGLIRPDELTLMLPLRKGVNELSIIVTDRFGGWAIMGRFPDMTGLRVEP